MRARPKAALRLSPAWAVRAAATVRAKVVTPDKRAQWFKGATPAKAAALIVPAPTKAAALGKPAVPVKAAARVKAAVVKAAVPVNLAVKVAVPVKLAVPVRGLVSTAGRKSLSRVSALSAIVPRGRGARRVRRRRCKSWLSMSTPVR